MSRTHIVAVVACLWLATTAAVKAADPPPGAAWDWTTATPESQGMNSTALEMAWRVLRERQTTAILVIRHDRLVFERYTDGHDRTKPHFTASLAKALVGGVGLMVAMDDGRIGPDDAAHRYVPQWRGDPQRRNIAVRHLATHTSGIEDAEADGLSHDRLTGWKGDFWKLLPPPRDPYTLARDQAPVREEPGTRERYSNPGMGMLGYCITACLRGTADADLRSLLKRRIMKPLGIPDAEWSVGYGTVTTVDGLPLVATWGGGSYSPGAVARIGRLMLRKGDWEGRRLVSPAVIERVTKPSGLPGHSGLGWWVNSVSGGSKLWASGPEDAFGGVGAGQQLLLVIPSLDLIVVRNGAQLDPALSFEEGLDRFVVAPVVRAIAATRRPSILPAL